MDEILEILLNIKEYCKGLRYQVFSLELNGNTYTFQINIFSDNIIESVDYIKNMLDDLGCRRINIVKFIQADNKNWYITLIFRY
jgi:hypothetical protein